MLGREYELKHKERKLPTSLLVEVGFQTKVCQNIFFSSSDLDISEEIFNPRFTRVENSSGKY